MFEDLVALLGDRLSRPTTRGHAVPVDTQLLCALQFYATGSFQWVIARNCGISQPTASRVIDDVTESLVAIAREVITFPRDPRQITAIKQEFQKLAGFPNVVGAIDGTHIAIRSPTVNEDAFVNRKGVHTINVQAVCTADLKFINIVAKWPGSTHDSFIWKNSSLKALLDSGVIQSDGWLLGDSGYPLELRLLTPYTTPATDAEVKFNTSHMKTRNVIERSFGVLKSRFRCLDKSGGTLLYTAEKTCKIIVAVAVLHNMCIDKKVPMDIDRDVQVRAAAIQPPTQAQQVVQQSASNLRRTIAQQF